MGMVVGGFGTREPLPVYEKTRRGVEYKDPKQGRTARWETTSFGGICPVQAEGWIEIDGRERRSFYFRSRHQGWSFQVFPVDDIEKVDLSDPWIGVFSVSGQWGEDEFMAGYMRHTTAHGIIDDCIRLFVCADLASLDQPEPEIKT